MDPEADSVYSSCYVRMCVVCMLSPRHDIYFEAFHWPTRVTWSLQRPLIGHSTRGPNWVHTHNSKCVEALNLDPWCTLSWPLANAGHVITSQSFIGQCTRVQNYVHQHNNLCVNVLNVDTRCSIELPSWKKGICATICTRQEIQCLHYAGVCIC